MKQSLYGLKEKDNASPTFLAKVASFRAELEEHIRGGGYDRCATARVAGESGNAEVTAQANKEGFKLA